MVLDDLGARVIKVERAGARRRRPPRRAVHRTAAPAYFTSLNRGKESIALDLEDAADRAVFERLLARADVLVENFRPGTMDKLGFGWDVLHARHPRLIYAAVSGFGRTGPYAARPAYDMVVQAMGGVMSITGEDGGPPTRVGTSIGDITAGLFLAIGINAALYHRDAHRRGHARRRRHARLPGRDPRERDRALHRDGRGAGADRRAPSVDHAVRRAAHRRRRGDRRGRQRQAVRRAVRGGRSTRAGDRPAVRRQPRVLRARPRAPRVARAGARSRSHDGRVAAHARGRRHPVGAGERRRGRGRRSRTSGPAT